MIFLLLLTINAIMTRISKSGTESYCIGRDFENNVVPSSPMMNYVCIRGVWMMPLITCFNLVSPEFVRQLD